MESPKAEQPFPRFKWGTPVKFVGGKYNGFRAVMRWCGEEFCSVTMTMEPDPTVHTIVEELRFIGAE